MLEWVCLVEIHVSVLFLCLFDQHLLFINNICWKTMNAKLHRASIALTA
jgi:hypothetical protein